MEISLQQKKEMANQAAQALASDDVASAREIYESILKVDAHYVVAIRALARMDAEQNRLQDAVSRWQQVRALRPDIRESSLRLGRLYRKLKMFPEAIAAYEDFAGIDPDHVEPAKVLPKLRQAARHAVAGTPETELQHIALAGVSYCGSTLLARILGGLSGVENVGESHWLTNRKDAGSGSEVDFDHDPDESLVHCFSCGPDCKVFTREFRKELQADPVNWYFKIGQQLKCRTLVTADKNFAKLTDMDPLLRMDAIIIFKSPLQAWYSNYRKIDQASSSMSPVTDVQEYMQKWIAAYESFLNDFPNRGDKIFLSFDAFCERPVEHLQRICDMLGLQFDPQVLEHSMPGQHCFGGNAGVNRSLRNPDYEFAINPLPALELPDDQVAAIENNELISRTHNKLMTLYRRDFGVVEPEILDNIETVLTGMADSQKVVTSKRETFLKAAEDAERNIRIRLRGLNSDAESLRQAEVTRQLLEQIDWDAYRDLQREYLSAESVRFHWGFIKYLNLDYWFDAKFRIAAKIGMADSSGLRILDIGAGPGHFPLVCQLLGHEVVGTDIDVSQTASWGKPHLYDALIDFFRLDRRTHRIEPFEAMTDVGARFDLITALMLKFNVTATGEVWGVKEWEFFLRDLATNQLSDSGRIFLKMNMTGRDTSQKYIDRDVLELFQSHGGQVDFDDSTVDFRDLRSFRSRDSQDWQDSPGTGE